MPGDRWTHRPVWNAPQHELLYKGTGTECVSSICAVLDQMENEMKSRLVQLGANIGATGNAKSYKEMSADSGKICRDERANMSCCRFAIMSS